MTGADTGSTKAKQPKTAAERAAANPGGRATFFEPVLLCALAVRPSHGYELRRAISDLSDGLVVVDPPRLYRLLRRLESEGLAASAWEIGGPGPRRRVYVLTAEGRALLDDWRAFLARQVHVAQLTTAAIDAVLDVWAPHAGCAPADSAAAQGTGVVPAQDAND